MDGAHAVADADAIFATNTSSISITGLATATDRPPKFIGLHFFSPVPVMGLIEIIRGLETDDATYEAGRAFAQELGKTVIESRDMPGFLVNRMLGPFINEAVFALMESTGSAEDIDTGARLGLNHPMGPLELSDFVGNDVMLNVHGRPVPRLRRPEVPGRAAAAPDGHRRPPRPQDRPRLLPLRREGQQGRLMVAIPDVRRPDPFALNEEERAVRDTVREIRPARARAQRRAAGRGGALRPAPVQPDGELGLTAIPYPEAYGGAGMSTFAWVLAAEEIAAADMGMAVSLSVHVLSQLPILAYGSEEQKERLLPPLAAGRGWGRLR